MNKFNNFYTFYTDQPSLVDPPPAQRAVGRLIGASGLNSTRGFTLLEVLDFDGNPFFY